MVSGVGHHNARLVRRRVRPLLVALVALVATLLPVAGGAAPASASTSTIRLAPASAANATAPKSAAHEHRSTHRAAARSSAVIVTRRSAGPTAAAGTGQRSVDRHLPTAPATGAAHPTGPPPAYALVSPTTQHRPDGRHPAAARGRAPPSSCAS